MTLYSATKSGGRPRPRQRRGLVDVTAKPPTVQSRIFDSPSSTERKSHRLIAASPVLRRLVLSSSYSLSYPPHSPPREATTRRPPRRPAPCPATSSSAAACRPTR